MIKVTIPNIHLIVSILIIGLFKGSYYFQDLISYPATHYVVRGWVFFFLGFIPLVYYIAKKEKSVLALALCAWNILMPIFFFVYLFGPPAVY